jgi:hypothetical protein
VNAADQYHAGIVVDDFDDALERLTALFGYEWTPEFGGRVPVRLPSGEREVELRVVYSRSEPRVEIIQAVPGTVWEPVSGSGIHHLGYWSDDVAADGARLVEQGYVEEASGLGGGGSAMWSYYRAPSGPRTELVSRSLEPFLAQLWA